MTNVISHRTLLLLGLCATLAGCTSVAPVAQDDSDRQPIRVRTVAAVQAEVDKVTLQPASVFAFYETAICSKLAGYIVAIDADIGDFVETGQVLAKVDVPEMEQRRRILLSRIELLKSQQQEASAGVELAGASVRSAESMLQQARSELGAQEASLAAAEAEFSRTEDLVNRGSLQARLLDEVREKRDAADANRSAVLSAVLSAEAEVGVAQAREQAAAAKAQTAASSTEVAVRELNELDVLIAYAEIRAPFAGVITHRHVNLGELIRGDTGGSSNPLFVLSQIDKVRVQIPIPESEAPFVQPGDAVTLSFPSFSGEPPIKTVVARHSHSLSSSTRTMTVEAVLDNADGKLLPGMFGQAAVNMMPGVATTMLPSRAVRFDEAGNAFVYLVDQGNRVQIAEVTTGMDTGTQIEILSGLAPGQTVVAAHLRRFAAGQLVQPL